MRHLFAVALATLALNATAATVDLSALNLAGSAQRVGGHLQLSSGSGHAGAGWVKKPVSTSASFSTSFSFSLQGQGFNGNMADGIALVFQNKGNEVVGNGGSDLGYWSLDGVGSIIQTWHNNTIGLSTHGVAQGVQSAGWNLGASQNVTGTETVNYNAASDVLTMSGSFLGDSTGITHTASDSAVVDLGSKFGGNMYLGCTGGTGGSYADQRITGLSVSGVPEPASYAMLLAGLGLLGCIARRRQAA